MIPILYDKNTTDFSNNGLGFLKDTLSCLITEERNGSYELSLQYPITGQWYDLIADGCIVKAKASETSVPQLFRIYKSSKPLNGKVTYSAEHISYDLNGLPTTGLAIKNATPQMAMTRLFGSSPFEHNFTAISDIATLNSTSIQTPCSVRSVLGGQTGSVLDVWGGEYEFDNFVVKLHAHRGSNNGVSIEYGKNLTDIKQESNITECYTHLMPYAVYTQDDGNDSSEEIYVYLSEQVIPLTNAENIGHKKACIMDFSDRFGENEIPTEEKLRAKANSYIKSANLGAPKINITVSFVQLWQTEEYKNIAPLERVKLCDIVNVRFSKLGITANSKVIKTVYDSLKEKYESLTLGDAKSSFADTINKQNSELASITTAVKTGQSKATIALKQAILNATNLITGHSGGYVVFNPAEKPQEILILDAPNIEEAVNVWRWNSGGLGHSSTGYNGEYSLAITMDGAIVADFITAGVINGALIQADSVESSAISQYYKAEVTSEIEESSNYVEQSFIAADEHLLSVIKDVKDVLDGDFKGIEKRTSTLEQKVDKINMSFTSQTIGGINLIKNSSGLNGVSNDWTKTGSVTINNGAEAVNNTSSGSMFGLRVATLEQTVKVIKGKKYTLSFKAFRDTEKLCNVQINNGSKNTPILSKQEKSSEWEEYSKTVTAAGDTLTLRAETTGYYFYVADFMLVEGEQKSHWTPAPNELYTENVKIDRRGIHITNPDSYNSTHIDHTQFAVKHYDKTVLSVNGDSTILQKTQVTGELTIGEEKGAYIPCDDCEGFDLVVFDE